MTYEQFKALYLHKTGVGNNSANKGQCVGLISLWMDNFSIPHEYGNAKDLISNADKTYVEVILNDLNDLNQHPNQGDIMVLGKPWGLVNGTYFGHTGVIDSANGTSYEMFEQNDITPQDTNGACEVLHHENYNGAIGWLRIKAFQPSQPPQPSPGGNTTTDTAAAITLDKTLIYLHSKSIIPSDKREDYINNDELVSRLTGYVNNMEDIKKKYEALLENPPTNPTALKNKIISFIETA